MIVRQLTTKILKMIQAAMMEIKYLKYFAWQSIKIKSCIACGCTQKKGCHLAPLLYFVTKPLLFVYPQCLPVGVVGIINEVNT
jgi:hypothetical protein